VTSPVSDKESGDQAGKPIAVFLLDDHEIVRRGVKDLLEAEPADGQTARSVGQA
jgi:hypothetical protein